MIQLSADDLSLVDHFARHAAVGGVSHVRAESDRADRLLSDQQVGQAGELALSRYLSGNTVRYALTRTMRDLTPKVGDQGGDLLGLNVDVKCSVMRASTDPLKYRLLVRPAERHVDVVYVLALVRPNWHETGQVTLVGWATADDLPPDPAEDGRFSGAYVLPATQLHPLPPIRFTSTERAWTSAG